MSNTFKKITVNINAADHMQLVLLSNKDGRKLGQYVRELLKKHVKETKV
jgi:predicted HicB family RNase H-like nuclease